MVEHQLSDWLEEVDRLVVLDPAGTDITAKAAKLSEESQKLGTAIYARTHGSSCGACRSGLDEDLDVLLLVVDQLVEAVLDDVVKGDPSGDELERIDLSARDHLDRCGMVVRVPEASQDVHLVEHEVVHRHRCLVAPDRDVHARPAGSGRQYGRLQDSVDPGAFADIRKEIYHGVVDTYDMDYDNGYARLLATLAQAAQLSPNCNALCIRVQTQDKQGLCHHLANEDALVWVKKDA